jgi:hypothetical protein
MDNPVLSAEYQAAQLAHKEAFKTFGALRDQYRAGKLADQAFVDARKTYDLALEAWDAAYQLERGQ